CISREKSAVVLDDDELAVTAQSAARVDDLARRARNDWLAGLASDVDALQIRGFGERRNDLALRRPYPVELVIVDLGNVTGLCARRWRDMRRSCRRERRPRASGFRRNWRRRHRRSVLQLRERLV